MKHLFAISLFLVACSPTPAEPLSDIPQVLNPLIQEEPVKVDAPIEQLPAELTISYFSDMKLEGKDLKLVATLANNDKYTRYQIEYLSNGLKISGIMNIPHGDGPFPLVIFNHGHIAPSVYTVGRGLKREQDYLATHGYAVLHTDYRGHGLSDKSPDTKEIYDAGLEYAMDSINAINAVRDSTLAELKSVDSEHVGMMGHSLGGGVTQNVLVSHPEMTDAAVLYAPVSGDAWDNFVKWRKERPEGDRTIAVMGTRESNPDAWDKLSSITYIKNIDDPVLIFQGTKDEDIPMAWTQRLEKTLKDAGKDVEFVVYENEKHEFIPKWEDFMQRTVQFLDLHLRQ